MDEKIKQALADAKAAMRRTPSGRRTDTAPTPKAGESLAERIAREAEEKATEALYAESYRRRLTEGTGEEEAEAPEETEAPERTKPEAEPSLTDREDTEAAEGDEVTTEAADEPTRVTKTDTALAECDDGTEPTEGEKTDAEDEDEREETAQTVEPIPGEGVPREEEPTEPKRRLVGFVIIPTGTQPPSTALTSEGGTPTAMQPASTDGGAYTYVPVSYQTDGKDLTDPEEVEYAPEYTAEEGYIPTEPTELLNLQDGESPEYRPDAEAEDTEPYTLPTDTDFGDTGEMYRGEEGYQEEVYDGTEPEQTDYTHQTEYTYPILRDTEERPTAQETDEVELRLTGIDEEKIEENANLVRLRMQHEIDRLKRERSMLEYTYTLDGYSEEKSARAKKKEISRRASRLASAVKRERIQSRVWYTVSLDMTEGNPKKRARNAAELESVLRRVEMLLSERDKINRNLTELYSAADGGKTEARASRRYVRAARRSYKAQRGIVKRLHKLHAPDELRERIIAMINERTQLYAQLEMTEHKLSHSHYSGAAKREARHSVRQMRRKIKYLDADIKQFMKRASRHDTTHRENGKQLAWIIGTLAVIGAVVGVYLFFKEEIDLFFTNLFTGKFFSGGTK